MGLSNSGLVDVPLSNELLAGAMEDEVTSASVGVYEEVHHRRNGLMSKTWKGLKNINGVEPSLACASLDSEVLDAVVSGGGQEESYVEDLVEDPGLGRWMLCVSKRPKWRVCQAGLFIVCGATLMLIGAMWIPEELRAIFSLCGTVGLFLESTLVWVDLWWHVILETWRMVWSGLLQECMAQIGIIFVGSCGRS
jgi:hypothetical protein